MTDLLIHIPVMVLMLYVFGRQPYFDRMKQPEQEPTPVPSHRIEKRAGALWSVVTCQNGTEIWRIVFRNTERVA